MKMKEMIVACALAAAIAVAPLAGCASQSGSGSSSSGAASSSSASSSASAASSSQASTASTSTLPTNEGYVLFLGTNDKDTNQPVYSREESKARAKAILMKNFGNYTIQEAEGGWKNDDGTEYEEYTLVIYLNDTDLNSVHAVADELLKEFNQSAVLINADRVETEFYEGK